MVDKEAISKPYDFELQSMLLDPHIDESADGQAMEGEIQVCQVGILESNAVARGHFGARRADAQSGHAAESEYGIDQTMDDTLSLESRMFTADEAFSVGDTPILDQGASESYLESPRLGPMLTSDDFRQRLTEHVAILKSHEKEFGLYPRKSDPDLPTQRVRHMPIVAEGPLMPIRGLRGGYMSPHNSDSELPRPDPENNEEDTDDDESSSEEEYDGDDLDAAMVTSQKPPTRSTNNPLLTDEPLVFQQRSKYFQRYQEIRESGAQKGGSHITEPENATIPIGGLFGSGALFESEKAATSTDSLGSSKRKREEEDASYGEKGKQREEDEKEAPLHDDIDDYERELRELEERNRKKAMTVKNE